ncbi:MAG: tRNA (guanosine(46)-N7)-methyltransferase TrmB [Bacteroidetes bacterium]|nr:tRNA (guanosine(46)-N7)-methyltransferase TrmB [Bacteroidota bacterium]
MNLNQNVVVDDKKSIRSFVLRGGRLTGLQKNAIEKYSGKYCIPFDTSCPLHAETIFNNSNPLIIEIGFGMGVTTASIAASFPGNNYLGIEVFLSGIGKLLHEINSKKLDNVRIIRFNAVDVLQEMIPDNSISGFHIFFPDPWPKKKHNKRRLVQKDFIEIMLKKLVPGGYIYTATDWTPYAEWMLKEFNTVEGLVNNSTKGYCDPVSWRPSTKFEQKGLDKKHTIHEIWVEKKTKKSGS